MTRLEAVVGVINLHQVIHHSRHVHINAALGRPPAALKRRQLLR